MWKLRRSPQEPRPTRHPRGAMSAPRSGPVVEGSLQDRQAMWEPWLGVGTFSSESRCSCLTLCCLRRSGSNSRSPIKTTWLFSWSKSSWASYLRVWMGRFTLVLCTNRPRQQAVITAVDWHRRSPQLTQARRLMRQGDQGASQCWVPPALLPTTAEATRERASGTAQTGGPCRARS